MSVEVGWSFYRHQWVSLPSLPKGKLLDGKTILITGGNSGVGLESIKQLATYSPARIILAVRTLDSGEKVAATLRKAHPAIKIEVWYVDMGKVESIKELGEKAKGLDRLDIFMANAGVNPGFDPLPIKKTGDGYEQTIQTNVLGTLLLALVLEPILARTGQIPRADKPLIVFTGSDTHYAANPDLIEKALQNGSSIIGDLNDEKTFDNTQRYMLSKLLLQMVTRSLITALPHIRIINANPGLSRTNLGRDFNFAPSLALVRMLVWYMLNSRSSYEGAKNLTTAVVSSKDSVDYWSECAPVYSESTFLPTGTGIRATKVVFKEFVDECEKIVPGCGFNLVL